MKKLGSIIIALILVAVVAMKLLNQNVPPVDPITPDPPVVDPVGPVDPGKDPEPAVIEKSERADGFDDTVIIIEENGIYDQKDQVAKYLHVYGHLPSNYITKKEARKLGWSSGGLDKYKKNGCIGGDYFGNNEGYLPKEKGLTYTECDIGTMGKKSRGSKRIVFSNKGDIYYTDDHYETFTLLYER